MRLRWAHVESLIVLAGMLSTALLLAGCGAAAFRNAPPNAAIAQRAVLANLPDVRAWGDEVPTNPAAEMKRRFPTLAKLSHSGKFASGQPVVETLALSGGGGDGAFGAGVLAGWSARGDRPKFQIVTGVSAGAIIAPFAFLGRHYDAKMQDIWTRYGTDQLFTAQILPGLLSGSAIADTAPMAALIEQYVDARMLAEIAAEYRKGRLLLVGTTNLDAQRPVVWNMGAIAASNHPDAPALFRRVILGSAAIPGLFPPVPIHVVADGKPYEEMHVDGGLTRELFLAPFEVPLRTFDTFYDAAPLRRIYIIKNGKLSPEYEPVTQQTIPISIRAITTMIKFQSLGDIYKIWRTTQDAGADFNLVAVPVTFNLEAKEAFDVKYQRALFEEGFRLGRHGNGWLKEPPLERTKR